MNRLPARVLVTLVGVLSLVFSSIGMATAEPTSAARASDATEAETLEYSGTGDTVLEVEFHDEPRIATFTHDGAANFSVWAIDSLGEQQALLVNQIGTYEGTVLYNSMEGEELAALEISADGAWQATLEPLTEAEPWEEGDNEFTGTGDDVLRLEWEPSGLTVLDISHTGKRNFAIWSYADSFPELLVNEIGEYEGQARLSADTVLLAVTADGEWTLSI